MALTFTLVDSEQDGDHSFAIYDCHARSEAELIEELAEAVRELYVELEHLRGALLAALDDASPLPGKDALAEAIERTTAASIPVPGTHPIPALDVARNELAEVLAYLALPAIHGTVVPASRVRNKETRDAPARGLDLVGLEDPPLVAVVGEVKASADADSPPGVVDETDDCLREQFKAFLATEDRLLTELNWALKHAKPEHKALVARAMLAHVGGTLPVVAAPILVRPVDRHQSGDFGSFRSDPEQFKPISVRFCLLRVDCDLESLAQAVYEKARA